MGPSGTSVSVPSAPRMTAALSVRPNACRSPTRVDHQQVAALVGPACAGRGPARSPAASPVSAAKPTSTGRAPVARRPARPGCRVAAASAIGRARRRRLLDLVLGALGRPEVGHRGRHHHHVGVRGRLVHGGLQLLGRADPHHVDARRAPAARRWRRPVATRAPRAAATAARAKPCRPDERLPRKRTGSSGSRVPPARDDHVRPARSRGSASARCSSSSASAGDLLRLGQPALAGVGTGQPPVAGLEHDDAARRAASPRWPARWPGAPTSRCASPAPSGPGPRGEQDVGEQVVGQAVPAARPSRSAVAGAMTTRSVSRPMAHVRRRSATSVQTSVATGWCDSASQVAAPTKRKRGRGRDDGDVVTGLGEAAGGATTAL